MQKQFIDLVFTLGFHLWFIPMSVLYGRLTGH